MDLPRPLNDWSKTHDGVPGIPVRQHLLAVFPTHVGMNRWENNKEVSHG